MKALRFTLVKTIVVSLLIGLPNVALARTSVHIRFGGGHQHSRRSYRPDHRRHPHKFHHHRRYFKPAGHSWRWRHYRPHRKTIILSGRYYYDRMPDYYVVTTPTIIRKTPVVIEKQTVVVQPQEFDESTLELYKKPQYKKSELLEQLETGKKEQRMEAIRELAGFSFDDKVRYALENVLLSDPDAQLRKEAARTFGKVKNTKALAALEKARVEDSNEDVRKEADKSIKKLEAN